MWIINLSFPGFIAILAATLLIVERKSYYASFTGKQIILINQMILLALYNEYNIGKYYETKLHK